MAELAPEVARPERMKASAEQFVQPEATAPLVEGARRGRRALSRARLGWVLTVLLVTAGISLTLTGRPASVMPASPGLELPLDRILVLVEMGSPRGMFVPVGPTSLMLDRTSLHLDLACGTGTSAFRVVGDRLIVERFEVTEPACEPPLTEDAALAKAVLSSSPSITRTDGRLRLISEAGTLVFVEDAPRNVPAGAAFGVTAIHDPTGRALTAAGLREVRIEGDRLVVAVACGDMALPLTLNGSAARISSTWSAPDACGASASEVATMFSGEATAVASVQGRVILTFSDGRSVELLQK